MYSEDHSWCPVEHRCRSVTNDYITERRVHQCQQTADSGITRSIAINRPIADHNGFHSTSYLMMKMTATCHGSSSSSSSIVDKMSADQSANCYDRITEMHLTTKRHIPAQYYNDDAETKNVEKNTAQHNDCHSTGGDAYTKCHTVPRNAAA